MNATLINIPGTQIWVNPAYVTSVSPGQLVGGDSTVQVEFEGNAGYRTRSVLTTASMDEVVKAISPGSILDAVPRVLELETALQAMWGFASGLVEKHGMEGDDSMTDQEHSTWQDAGGHANSLLGSAAAGANCWWAVTGRNEGDDEDTCLVLNAVDKAAVVRMFSELMDKGAAAEDLFAGIPASEHKVSVKITSVFASATQILEQ